MSTKKPRATGTINFLPVEPRPCERIIGGIVVGKAVAPTLEEPIGWIVSCPTDQQQDEPPKAGELRFWHFPPTCGIEPTLSGFAGQGPLQIAVREQYRGIYDRMPYKHRRQIAKGDDCEIGDMVLEWCGLSRFWEEHELWDDYSVIWDVLLDCRSIVSWSREWEGGPGLSGDMYYVETEDPTLSIREIRKITEALLAEKRAKPPPPPPPPKKPRKSAKRKPK
ncbi:MAG: hypothetical protein K9M97_08135 [Akkermansiaceae bacterium]|nr:hypothetical protein [Akkermansiaceae bacterium]